MLRPLRHYASKDSEELFFTMHHHATSNYNIKTTSHAEYLLVVDPLGSGLTTRMPSDLLEVQELQIRIRTEPSEFLQQLAARNEELENLGTDKLFLQEFHAARLFTGPMVPTHSLSCSHTFMSASASTSASNSRHIYHLPFAFTVHQVQCGATRTAQPEQGAA